MYAKLNLINFFSVFMNKSAFDRQLNQLFAYNKLFLSARVPFS